MSESPSNHMMNKILGERITPVCINCLKVQTCENTSIRSLSA